MGRSICGFELGALFTERLTLSQNTPFICFVSQFSVLSVESGGLHLSCYINHFIQILKLNWFVYTDLPLYICSVMRCFIFRGFIFPYLMKSGKSLSLGVFLCALSFCVMNGYLQTGYLLYHAKFSSDWATTPNTYIGQYHYKYNSFKAFTITF